MKKVMATMMLLAGGLLAAPSVAVRIGIGGPAPVAVVRPACPGAGYVWVDGYYGPNRAWVNGYWRAPVVHVDTRFDHDRHFDHGRDFHRDHRDDRFRR